MKKAFALAIALVCLAAVAFASEDWRGENRLAGFVVDKSTGKPVPKAKISMRWQRGSHGGPDFAADENGKWAILGIAPGYWNMDVEAPGYVVRQLGPIAINLGARNPPMKVELEPAAIPKEETVTKEEVKIGGQVVSKEIADAVEAANAALTAKNYKEAIANYEKATAALPAFMPLKLALARSYYGANQLPKAITTMTEVYNADPTNGQNGVLLANMLLENQQIDRAEAIMEKLPEGSLTMDTLLNTGIAMMNKKQPAAAVSYFTKAIKMDATSHLGYYYRALAQIQAGKTKEAKPDLLKVVELAPTSAEATEAKEYLKSIK